MENKPDEMAFTRSTRKKKERKTTKCTSIDYCPTLLQILKQGHPLQRSGKQKV